MLMYFCISGSKMVGSQRIWVQGKQGYHRRQEGVLVQGIQGTGCQESGPIAALQIPGRRVWPRRAGGRADGVRCDGVTPMRAVLHAPHVLCVCVYDLAHVACSHTHTILHPF